MQRELNKNYDQKMQDLKTEEQNLIKKLNQKQEKDWANLKGETKQLMTNKEKELNRIYQKQTSQKESELEK